MSDIRNCPTCDSPAPNLHPSVQSEGEVQPCKDPWHTPPPDAQGMTREQVVGICLDFFGDLPTVEQHQAIVKLRDNDAAQRETIRRLEGENANLLSKWRASADLNKGLLRDYDALQARLKASEREVRKRMWTLHYSRMRHAPYGDDGRLDCNSCGRDYVATPMDELVQWEMLDASKLVTASEAKRKWTTARPTVAGMYWWRANRTAAEQIIKVLDDFTAESMTGCSDHVDEIGGEFQGPLTPGEE